MSSALVELTLTRIRLFFREPAALFWAFGFPLVLSLALGVAFRNKPPDPVGVGVEDNGTVGRATYEVLRRHAALKPQLLSPDAAQRALHAGKIALLVSGTSPVVYTFDKTRPETLVARMIVDDALQRAAGMRPARPIEEKLVSEPGARYIDFLIPGLLGMNIMSSGMWGIGFVIVEMRTRRLLKRMAATPMRRSEFLLSFILSRLVFLMVELPLLLLFAYFVFGVAVRGSLPLFVGLSFLGAFTFSGIGLLVASRTASTQTAGGLMNLVMMPMFICSGVFFSSANFPDVVQPLIKLLPLTALNDSLRAVMNEGAGVSAITSQVLILAAFGVITFAVAVRTFRWQ